MYNVNAYGSIQGGKRLATTIFSQVISTVKLYNYLTRNYVIMGWILVVRHGDCW
jgi:hypothetical protein